MSIWDALIGGGLSYLGAQQSAKAAQEAAAQQAAALSGAAASAQQAASPWSVGGLGGTATFDQNKQAAVMGLSPELADIYSGALSRAGLWGQQVGQYASDPFALQQQFYEQQQALAAPEEQQLRTDLETRMLAQGRLGSTGGQRAMGELEKQIMSARDQRRANALTQSQALIDSLLGRESADLGQATGLLNIPLQYANIGRGIGGDLGQAALGGLQARTAGIQGLAQANAFSPAGTAMTAAGGLFLNPYQKQG